MNTVRSLATLMTLLMIGSAALAATDPRQDPSSFYRLATSATPNGINSELTPSCKAALKKTLRFPSRAISKYLVLPKDYPREGASSGVFYHYTPATEVRELVNAGRPDEIFSYLRQLGTADPFLYVAGDPESSREYGPIQIRVQVSTRSPIFVLMKTNLYGTREPDPKNQSDANIKWWGAFEDDRESILKEITDDVIGQTPQLKVCRAAKFGVTGLREFPLLMILAIEDARIPLMAYYGTGKNWFAIMGEWAIETMSVGTAPSGAADSFEVGAP